jgi:hypothetical protein
LHALAQHDDKSQEFFAPNSIRLPSGGGNTCTLCCVFALILKIIHLYALL